MDAASGHDLDIRPLATRASQVTVVELPAAGQPRRADEYLAAAAVWARIAACNRFVIHSSISIRRRL
ncbi:hypothetical protein LCGC14_0583380 [marine sediment metagenome]|uniref:Uncharacterized protein n=1 Tax=marine sediment metagenome TaxID=412755 RepID=A0A0F9UP11_9ZZZZ